MVLLIQNSELTFRCFGHQRNIIFIFILHVFISGCFFFFKKYLFICLYRVFVAVCTFLWLWQAGATHRCGRWASHCGDFFCCRAQALDMQASAVVADGLSSCDSQAAEHRLSSWGAQAWLLQDMLNLPPSGIKPMSSALAGEFFTIEPARKPSGCFSWLATLQVR